MEIKSTIHNYTLKFDSINNISIDKDDFVIVDGNLSGDFWSEIDSNPKFVVDVTERSKEYSNITPIIDDIIKSGFRKNNKLIAIGGGVVQDITGFISSILYRGVKWVFYPTTLLAQGDSCIGGKTSINFGEFKNQLGGFYPPHEIIIDTNFLKTLPKLQMYSGIGEMAHYFFIEGRNSFDFFSDHIFHMGQLDVKALIEHSLEIKKCMVEIDEFDVGPRRVFNYGHSFGHAIESITNYDIPHGVAVSYGMDISNYVSMKMGYITKEEYDEMYKVLKLVHKIKGLPHIDLDDMMESLSKDKKNIGTTLGLVLTKGLGNMFLEQVSPDIIKPILKDYFRNEYISNRW
jgi:3-dehydroquinate synthase